MKSGDGLKKRGPRLWLRRITFGSLGLLLLLSAAFLLRKPIFSGLVLSTIRERLSQELGVPVQATSLEGNWWSRFELGGLSFSGAAGPVQSLAGARVILEVAPWQLLGRGLGALRSLDVHAQRMTVVVPSPSTRQTAETPADIDASDVLALALPLFPRGIGLDVDELTFGSRSGPTRIRIGALSEDAVGEASPRERTLHIQGPDLAVTLEVHQLADRSWSLSTKGEITDLGELLQDLGSDLPIHAGAARFDASLDGQGIARGRLKIQGMLYESRELQSTRLEFEVQEHRIQIPELQVELPGLRIHGRDLLLPRAAGTSDLHPELWKGNLSIRIENLEPYRTRLSRPIRDRLPIQGDLEGKLDAGQLILSQAELHGRGVLLRIAKGHIPILGDYRRQSGELQGRLEVTQDIEIQLAPMGELSLRGSFEGRWTGSLEQPVLDGRLDATARSGKGRIHIMGQARSADEKYRLSEMSLEVTGIPEMKLAGSMDLDTAQDRGRFDLEGNVDSKTLQGLGILPTLPRQVLCPEMSLKGTVRLGAKPELDAALSMKDITSDGRSVGKLDGRVAWKGKEELHISEFVVRPLPVSAKPVKQDKVAGNIRLEAKGKIPLSRNKDWDLRVEGQNLSLDFIGPFLSLSLPRSRLDLSARVHGPFGSPSFSLDTGGLLLQHAATLLMTLDEEQIRYLPQLPLAFRTKIEASPHHIHVERLRLTSGDGKEMLRLEGKGNLPFGTEGLAKDLGVDLFEASFHWNHETAWAESTQGSLHLDRQGIRLGPLTIAGPDGSAQGELRLGFDVQDLLAGRIGMEEVKLTGKLNLEQMDLGKIPRAWIQDLDLSGRVDGEITLGGNLAQPEPRMRLALKDVGLKVRGAPRIEKLGGAIEVQPKSIRLHGVGGKIGVSDFAVRGGLESPGPLWQDFDRAKLQVELDGKDLMLVRSRGLRLLGNTHLRAAGSPRAVKVTGEVEIESGKYNERQSLLMIDPARRGGASIPGFVPFVLEGELGKRVSFDVKLTTLDPFLIRTGLVDADVNAELRLQGPGSQPFLVGAVTALRGWIRMPAAKLRLEQALIFFKKDRPLFPELDVAAVYRRKGHEIRMRVQGTYDKPSLLLSSSPHLEYEQILVFLSTGQLPKDLEGRAMESMLLAAGSYGANELWGWLIDTGSTNEQGETFFDRFSVETGQDFGTSGVESLRVEYKLAPKWFMQVERDADGFYNMGLVFRISF